jgi:D-alanine-D-alanine ligase
MVFTLTNVGVLFGGPSPEHDVSVLTGLQACRSLSASGRYTRVETIFWSKNGDFFLVHGDREAKEFADGAPKDAEPLTLVSGSEGGFVVRKGRLNAKYELIDLDAVVICAHGGPGEDGSLQGALDLAGVAYTGPSTASAALGMDKFATGEVVRGAGLPTLDRFVLTEDLTSLPIDGPYIVKPRFGGSSIGIDVVHDFATAKARLRANVHLRRGAVIEAYRADLHDLQIALCTYPILELSAIERPLRAANSREILNYQDKYVGGTGMDAAARQLPAEIPDELAQALRAAATRAASVLGVRGIARIDFLSDGQTFMLNEINTIPGSLSKHLFIDPPVHFDELLWRMLSEAKERPAAQFNSAGADGSLLRDAKSISVKLG